MIENLCGSCKGSFSELDLLGAEAVRPSIHKLLTRDFVGWNAQSKICGNCLEEYRVRQIQELLEEEHGELSALDERVLESISEHELVTKNINSSYEQKLTFGQWLSDKMASFGGSWFFLIIFTVFLIGWIIFNSFGPKKEEFDPYPYIFLNLILSCLAAVQAPIIMMSQNRQEAKDRIRSEHEYLVNLKAELEVRQLHMKMDQLLKHQWRRLLEIQQLQIEMMNEALRKSKNSI